MVSTFYLTFLLGALLSLVAALPTPIPNPSAPADPTAGRSRECGVQISAKRINQAERRFRSHRLPSVPDNATATLGVYFHVVYANETAAGGYVSDQHIRDQIDVMNRDYKSTGIGWVLRGISRVKSEDWFLRTAPESEQEMGMKKLYRNGTKADLNVYTVGFQNPDASGLLGIATFPMDYKSAPQSDGVMLLHSTLPGSSSAQFNMGRTLVHEAGHWAGLYHTFQGGCESPGDEVDDTPPEASPAKGCPTSKKTCPGTTGLDATRNFMNYSDDSCMDNFTPGQSTRMRQQLMAFRGVQFK
jgi:hypothetical protein